MHKSMRSIAVSTKQFNFNKLQAVVCIGSSAMCSVALIYWAVKTFT